MAVITTMKFYSFAAGSHARTQGSAMGAYAPFPPPSKKRPQNVHIGEFGLTFHHNNVACVPICAIDNQF